jgi:hypothetical protein
MDDTRCRQFFLQPHATFHRRYEALRAYFIEGQRLATIAERFAYRLSSLKSLVCRFRASCLQDHPTPFFFRTAGGAPLAGGTAKTRTDRSHRRSRTPDS